MLEILDIKSWGWFMQSAKPQGKGLPGLYYLWEMGRVVRVGCFLQGLQGGKILAALFVYY